MGWRALCVLTASSVGALLTASAARADDLALERPECATRCPCPRDPLLERGPRRACGDVYAAGGFTFLPNVGGVLEVGRVVRAERWGTTSVELQLGLQPIDDKTFIDNGDPPAGAWYQAGLGLKWADRPEGRRHWVYRAGAFWFQANGAPNWVDTPGDWFGAYVGFGFETDVRPDLSIGPSLTLLGGFPTQGDEGFHVTPQLTWRLTWWLGSRCAEPTSSACLPPGELYVDAHADLSPGFGGGIGGGQVFARERDATWSFELSAVFEPLDEGTLFAESDGDFAQVSGGVKASFRPGCRSHPVLRAGATWLRNTGEITWVPRPGDYLGAYASAGWEWDLGQRLTMGPELSLSVVLRESGNEVEFVPRLAWHVIWKL